MQAGARVEVGELKRNPMDFALWKEAKPGEPFWECPWGKGRPGWHIECSAMSSCLLGDTFDIHGGGRDLIFPHHENEIAQSEAASGKPFVRYWLHNGFVNINAEKMSKSLGNFFTIREVLDRYDSEVLRFFLLSAHYRSPIDFSDQNLAEAEVGLERIYKALAGVEEALAGTDGASGASGGSAHVELGERLASFETRFREAMDDDFNTAQALGHIFDLVRSVNRFLADNERDSSLLEAVRSTMARVAEVFGIFTSEPAAFLARMQTRKAGGLAIAVEEIERLIEERTAARKAKDFKRSDEIRDFLLERGVALLDGPQGTGWKAK
jgi:cysteinyl-tRNA synthetase